MQIGPDGKAEDCGNPSLRRHCGELPLDPALPTTVEFAETMAVITNMVPGA